MRAIIEGNSVPFPIFGREEVRIEEGGTVLKNHVIGFHRLVFSGISFPLRRKQGREKALLLVPEEEQYYFN